MRKIFCSDIINLISAVNTAIIKKNRRPKVLFVGRKNRQPALICKNRESADNWVPRTKRRREEKKRRWSQNKKPNVIVKYDSRSLHLPPVEMTPWKAKRWICFRKRPCEMLDTFRGDGGWILDTGDWKEDSAPQLRGFNFSQCQTSCLLSANVIGRASVSNQ